MRYAELDEVGRAACMSFAQVIASEARSLEIVDGDELVSGVCAMASVVMGLETDEIKVFYEKDVCVLEADGTRILELHPVDKPGGGVKILKKNDLN